MRNFIFKVGLVAFYLSSVVEAKALDVFVIGDSQIGYNHHRGFEDFFNNPKKYCGKNYKHTKFDYAGYGASGSGFHDWLNIKLRSDERQEHGLLCNPLDQKRWFSNAYEVKTTLLDYVQTDGTPVDSLSWNDMCEERGDESFRPIDRVVNLQPKVIVASFLGAHSAMSDEDIVSSVEEFEKSLPDGMACLVVTSPPILDIPSVFTVPVLRKMFSNFEVDEEDEGFALVSDMSDQEIVEIRSELFTDTDSYQIGRARAALAIHETILKNQRCKLVTGFDDFMLDNFSKKLSNYLSPEKIAEAFAGNFFFDSFHLSEQGSLEFFNLKSDELCEAFEELL